MTPDFVWRAGETAANAWCMRFLDSQFTDGIPTQFVHFSEHSNPCYYLARNYINAMPHNGHFAEMMIRPDMLDMLPVTPASRKNYNYTWHQRSIKERIQMCLDTKIAPRDYILDHPFDLTNL